eukprot:TRINITY_DN1631_c0_g1_i1.p1 TRINITY_DN1631_c0_g1~~TRINITY_DN1631_c0_g1_i1.p1  ORF type:complete len:1488 (-),score=376.84 TRINITY_DN1631_c0_g1_i1:19-4482(-)
MAGMKISLLLLCLCLLQGLVSSSVPVEATIRTPWATFPIHSEISEFVATASNTKFWSFLDGILNSWSDEFVTDKQQYDHAVSVASPLLGSTELSLLDYSLSLHYFNPRLEMYRQLSKQTLARLSTEAAQVENCTAWVTINGKTTCSPEDFEDIFSSDMDPDAWYNQLYSFDHTFPSNVETAPIAILYGAIGETNTGKFHRLLSERAESGIVRYVFRHYFGSPFVAGSEFLNVQGFGIDLALKSLEYKVIDEDRQESKGKKEVDESGPIQGFDFAKLTKKWPEYSSELLSFKASLMSEEFDLETLKVWEVADLGVQATKKIIESPEPLRMLRDISQNLPSLAHTLARERVDEEQLVQISAAASHLVEYKDTLWINGIPYDAASIDPFMLYKTMENQLSGLAFFNSTGVKPSPKVQKFLSLHKNLGVVAKVNVETELIDWSNNLRADRMYQRWSPNLDVLNENRFQGQFAYISQNLYSAVLVVDPGTKEGLEKMIDLANYMQQVPLRFGYLFDVNNEQGVAMVKYWRAIKERQGIWPAFQFVAYLWRSGDLSMESINSVAVQMVGNIDAFNKDPANDVSEYLEETKKFLEAKGISAGMSFLNGHLVASDEGNNFISVIAQKMFELEGEIKTWFNEGKLTNAMFTKNFNVHQWILEQTNSGASYDPVVYPQNKADLKFIDHSEIPSLTYLVGPDYRDQVIPVSHIIVGDLSKKPIRNFIVAALNRIETSNLDIPARVSWLTTKDGEFLHFALESIISASGANPQNYLPIVKKILSLEDSQITKPKLLEIVSQYGRKISEKYQASLDKLEAAGFPFGSKAEHFLENSDCALITNGRLLAIESPEGKGTSFFGMAESSEFFARAQAPSNLLEELSFDVDSDLVTSEFLSEKLMRIVAFLNKYEGGSTNPRALSPPSTPPSFEINEKDADFKLILVVDPLSTVAQKVSPMIAALVDHFEVDLEVHLKTPTRLSDIPLKNFYRYVVDKFSFDEDGKLSKSNGVASFLNLPDKRLLSMTVHVPGSWLVSSYEADYDLDNIVLSKLPKSTSVFTAVFQLDHILIEGTCADLSQQKAAPRALEIVLGNSIDAHTTDSLVMSNLGYFQLKASPNIWNIKLADGQPNYIYKVEGFTGQIIMDSWVAPMRELNVRKREGREHLSLFQSLTKEDFETEGEEAAFKQIEKVKTEDEETIHIFSLASGHLYERFLKIMMLSVVNNTKSPVKFWFLSNFLSPQFKKFVPHFAEKYNFSVELVTYKWPDWLHHQTEKQRIIWGYKILFLDVLFPVDLKKVIYVDADQIVRTDMKELMEFDLEGAPYGYTPFCSGKLKNPETTGFRFWDSGFWESHLGGKPYHISALYVVDLHQLRKTAAADRLRATYAQLSQDPNSLSNLDQDLPNYLQFNIPIKSLPENWLWCETWCTKDSQQNAKTIDLCNNPLTKVPKLEAATRLIPEWTTYDNLAKEVEEEVKNGGVKKETKPNQSVPKKADEEQREKEDL